VLDKALSAASVFLTLASTYVDLEVFAYRA